MCSLALHTPFYRPRAPIGHPTPPVDPAADYCLTHAAFQKLAYVRPPIPSVLWYVLSRHAQFLWLTSFRHLLVCLTLPLDVALGPDTDNDETKPQDGWRSGASPSPDNSFAPLIPPHRPSPVRLVSSCLSNPSLRRRPPSIFQRCRGRERQDRTTRRASDAYMMDGSTALTDRRGSGELERTSLRLQTTPPPRCLSTTGTCPIGGEGTTADHSSFLHHHRKDHSTKTKRCGRLGTPSLVARRGLAVVAFSVRPSRRPLSLVVVRKVFVFLWLVSLLLFILFDIYVFFPHVLPSSPSPSARLVVLFSAPILATTPTHAHRHAISLSFEPTGTPRRQRPESRMAPVPVRHPARAKQPRGSLPLNQPS
ncbi:hypothetical protein B0H19DRAFT_1249825 [Mycena capillaripes]|nr:hypothetical protein B0H19DRAFT_1249825 [Mycena capillaripes]